MGREAAAWRPTLYLHIGAAKSGSSAIQAALRRNASLLKDRGVLVPTPELKPGGQVSGGHVEFFERFLPVTSTGIATVADRLAGLARHMRSQALRAAVISAENLVNNSEFPRLFQPAQDEFDIRVVIYIRRQDEYLVAAWSQWHFKEHPDFSDWVASVVRRGLSNWHAVLTWWERVLPGASIDVRLFERDRFPAGDVALDFMQAIGVDAGGMEMTRDSINRTLNEVAMRVATRNRNLFVNAQDHDFLEFLAAFGDDAAVSPVNTGLFFDQAGRRAVLDAYSESNERVRARYFPEMPSGALFALDGPGAAAIDHERQVELELDLMWNVLYRLFKQTRRER